MGFRHLKHFTVDQPGVIEQRLDLKSILFLDESLLEIGYDVGDLLEQGEGFLYTEVKREF